MAPVRLIQAPPVREAGMPFDVAMGLLLTALAWGCAAFVITLPLFLWDDIVALWH